MKPVRKIELLAPAKNLICGKEAILHGADAVYIGAPQFSARAAAGNSIEDIRMLAEFAHTYFAKVYVALNTILTDSELKTAEQICWDVYHAGADALIIQDMGLLELNLPPLPLHASTQTDNRTMEKVQFLEKTGFSQIVLARELSLEQIAEIARNTSAKLEVFVHGALCTSYSGQCYISQHLYGRSSNRGECAQCCRLPYTLQDASGLTIGNVQKHWLSLKDLNHSAYLEAILATGVHSLKIEGRLKEVSYVKNVTAYYRKQLDQLFEKHPEYMASSSGKCRFGFTPDPSKSFNRGFTSYFLKGKMRPIHAVDSPKSTGEPIGNVRDIGKNYFTLSGNVPVHNGDGLCFFDKNESLQGFRVNRVENQQIFPAKMPCLNRGTALFRNVDYTFEKQLAQSSSERKIAVDFILEENSIGLSLIAIDEDLCRACVIVPCRLEEAQKDQRENIQTQLSKLGNTVFRLNNLEIQLQGKRFIPSSILNELRRKVMECLISVRKITQQRPIAKMQPTSHPFPVDELNYSGNVSNQAARQFYFRHGIEKIAPAFELSSPQQKVPLMFTKYCILYHLGYCKQLHEGKQMPWKEPLCLIHKDVRLELRFDCKSCGMMVE